jgi:RNA polymerase II subunit A small phosphatase-like protein
MLVFAMEKPLPGRSAADFRVGPYHVYKRPHLDTFLAACRNWFEMAVWTSASPLYAAQVVAALISGAARVSLCLGERPLHGGV